MDIVGYTHPLVKVTYISPEKGYGLVAQGSVDKHALIASWSGLPIHRDQADLLDDHAKAYLIRIRGTDYLMHSAPLRNAAIDNIPSIGVAFMANSSLPGRQKANALQKQYLVNSYYTRIEREDLKLPPADSKTRLPVLCLVASRHIERGEEILFRYKLYVPNVKKET